MGANKLYVVLVSVFLTLLGLNALAQDFLTDAEHFFFGPAMYSRRIGIEIEFSGIADSEVEKILIEKMHARVTERLASGEILFETRFGEVKLKIEGQAWRYETDPEAFARQTAIDFREAPREIVFPPVTYQEIDALQSVADALKASGAIGTTESNAVSLQTNVEWPSLIAPSADPDGLHQKHVDDLVALMRIYSRPEHARQIDQKIRVPAIRREYIRDYSRGFLRRLFKQNYRPTARELFDDYFYRQSAELLGLKHAWGAPIDQVKKLLLAQPDPVVAAVAKMLRLRVSSVLLQAFPDDRLSRLVTATRWARAMPLVEFREANNDFNIKGAVRQALGIVRSAELFGDYEHDALISKLSGINSEDLERLRQLPAESSGALRIVRYLLEDPKEISRKNSRASSPNAVWIQLDPDHTGIRPLIVSGDSVVYNRRHIHRKTLQGKYNPGLENALIQQVMENKIFEAKAFAKYAPGAMARMLLLKDLLAGERLKLGKLLELLKVEFPNGWVMKSAWDLATEKMFISDKLDLLELVAKYHDGFEEHRARVERQLSGANPEKIIDVLKRHPGYRGWKIMQMLAQPDQVFFQERMRIDTEYRLEVQGGKVLGKGSTIDRYYYTKEGKRRHTTKKRIQEVESFAQRLVDRLPEALRYLPFGFDVAVLENGALKLLESNAGGNSSFLDEHPLSKAALDEYLRNYPKLVESGKIKTLSAEDQMNWIFSHLLAFEMSPETHYPGMTFAKNDISDPEYPPISKPRWLCEKLLTELGNR